MAISAISNSTPVHSNPVTAVPAPKPATTSTSSDSVQLSAAAKASLTGGASTGDVDHDGDSH